VGVGGWGMVVTEGVDLGGVGGGVGRYWVGEGGDRGGRGYEWWS